MPEPGLPRSAIAILSNPLSRGHLEGRASLGPAATTLRHVAPEGREALRATLAGLAAEGTRLLLIHGGDGTLREVLSLLPDTFPASPPLLAPLPAGRTNLAARALWGQRQGGAALLEALLAVAEAGTLRRQDQPLLELSWTDAPERGRLRGLLFGAGAMAEATELAQAEVHRRGLNDGAGVAVAGLVTAFQAITGRGTLGRRLRAGSAATLAIDGIPAPEGDRFILMATPLPRLMLGLYPFWGAGQGALRWLDVAAPPRGLVSGLVSVLRGRDPRRPGWRSGRAQALALTLARPFVLDGELFDPGPAGIRLSATPPVTFVAP